MIEGVGSVTAGVCAYGRAGNGVGNPGFEDFLALPLLGAARAREIDSILGSPASGGIREALGAVSAARSAWAEARLREFARGKDAVQYVILGAGLDTFAWRNRDSRIRVFEVDHPATQRGKRLRIETLGWRSASHVTFTSVDFTREKLDERLLESGFDPGLSSFFTILGVSYYLPLPAFSRTVEEISSLALGESRLLFDYQSPDSLRNPESRAIAAFTWSVGEPMAKGYGPREVDSLLFRHRWEYGEELSGVGIADRFGVAAHRGAFAPLHFLAAGRKSP